MLLKLLLLMLFSLVLLVVSLLFANLFELGRELQELFITCAETVGRLGHHAQTLLKGISTSLRAVEKGSMSH